MTRRDTHPPVVTQTAIVVVGTPTAPNPAPGPVGADVADTEGPRAPPHPVSAHFGPVEMPIRPCAKAIYLGLNPSLRCGEPECCVLVVPYVPMLKLVLDFSAPVSNNRGGHGGGTGGIAIRAPAINGGGGNFRSAYFNTNFGATRPGENGTPPPAYTSVFGPSPPSYWQCAVPQHQLPKVGEFVPGGPPGRSPVPPSLAVDPSAGPSIGPYGFLRIHRTVGGPNCPFASNRSASEGARKNGAFPLNLNE